MFAAGKIRCFLAVVLACYFGTALGHGVMSFPRSRGALRTQRNLDPKEMVEDAPIDYCPHCQNAGGVDMVMQAGPWSRYEPMKSARGGFGMCGDPSGLNDHMKYGKFANPPSMPYVAVFEPGSVVNFEFDITASHNGYLEFYLCDVSKMPGQDISFEGFGDHCHYLERVPHESCEGGYDKECGPVDPKHPGRWVLPCRYRAGDQGDQIVGGSNGKMAYRLPNVEIEMGVVQNYWLAQNNCNDPDGFMDNYNYPKAWAGCPGDGGSVGGKPLHESCNTPGKFPEEYWNCADVQVLYGGESSPKSWKNKSPSDRNDTESKDYETKSDTEKSDYSDSGDNGHSQNDDHPMNDDQTPSDYSANGGGSSGYGSQPNVGDGGNNQGGGNDNGDNSGNPNQGGYGTNDYMAHGSNHCVGQGVFCQPGSTLCCDGGECVDKDGSGYKCVCNFR